MVTVYARHIAYDLRGIPVLPFSCEGVILAMEGLKANAAADCPFSFSTDKETGAAFSVTKPQSIWGTLGGQEGSILDTFGGEYDFDRFDVRLLGRVRVSMCSMWYLHGSLTGSLKTESFHTMQMSSIKNIGRIWVPR